MPLAYISLVDLCEYATCSFRGVCRYQKPALFTAQRTVHHPVGICNLIAKSSTWPCGVSANTPRVLFVASVMKPALLTTLEIRYLAGIGNLIAVRCVIGCTSMKYLYMCVCKNA